MFLNSTALYELFILWLKRLNFIVPIMITKTIEFNNKFFFQQVNAMYYKISTDCDYCEFISEFSVITNSTYIYYTYLHEYRKGMGEGCSSYPNKLISFLSHVCKTITCQWLNKTYSDENALEQNSGAMVFSFNNFTLGGLY